MQVCNISGEKIVNFETNDGVEQAQTWLNLLVSRLFGKKINSFANLQPISVRGYMPL